MNIEFGDIIAILALMFSIYTNRSTIENLKLNIGKAKEETNYSPFD